MKNLILFFIPPFPGALIFIGIATWWRERMR